MSGRESKSALDSKNSPKYQLERYGKRLRRFADFLADCLGKGVNAASHAASSLPEPLYKICVGFSRYKIDSTAVDFAREALGFVDDVATYIAPELVNQALDLLLGWAPFGWDAVAAKESLSTTCMRLLSITGQVTVPVLYHTVIFAIELLIGCSRYLLYRMGVRSKWAMDFSQTVKFMLSSLMTNIAQACFSAVGNILGFILGGFISAACAPLGAFLLGMGCGMAGQNLANSICERLNLNEDEPFEDEKSS